MNQEPNVDYLGHPINAYNLIKHTAMGWRNFHDKIIPPLNETMSNFEYFMNRPNNTAIPDYHEINGAAYGVARLQSIYNLEPNSIFKEGIIDTNLNLKHIRHVHVRKKWSKDQWLKK